MTMSAADQALIVSNEAAAMRAELESGAEEKGLKLEIADARTNKVLNGLSASDFAELYSSSSLEMRLKFENNNNRYSRLRIIAPNPATARGWGGTVLRDEAAFTSAAMENELRIATKPILDTDPTFKIVYASNLCADDRHPFFEMTMPPPDKVFPPNPDGHLYRGQNNVLVHRVSLADAYAAGHVLYDNNGQPLTLEKFRSLPGNQLGRSVNYDLLHEAGGSAAIDLMALLTSQRRGAQECAFIMTDDEASWQRACERLRELWKSGRVGIGFDVASTTSETSNPSSITVTEMSGTERKQRLVCIFKSKKRALMVERLRDICRIVRGRPAGGPAVRLCIDASNERLAAEEIRDDLRGVVPVELVVAGSSIHPPGYREATNYKTYLNDLYSAAINDNRYALPADEYIKLDHRLTVKDQGRYSCQVDGDGRHGDTFDSGKQAEWALASRGQTCRVAIAAQVGGYEGGGAFF